MLSLFVFVIQICLFGALALYLHYLSEHYGFAPLLFFVAGSMGVLNLIEFVNFYIEPAPNILLRPGGHVYVPIILLIVLVVYISSGTRTARITIAGLIGIDLLILVVLLFLSLYQNIQESPTAIRGVLADTHILTPLFFRGVIASIITFSANMFVIVIIYQGIRNAFPMFPESLIPGIALLIALWVDAILFNILAFFGTGLYTPSIPSDILIKSLAGLLLAPLAGWYLTRIAPNLTHYVGASHRTTLEIVFGADRFASRLTQLESELSVSRAIYDQIVHHIEEVFWLVDIKKERLLYLSPNFETLTGRPRTVFYNDPAQLLSLVHPDDRGNSIVEQVFLAPETTFRIITPDGTIRWLRNRSFPIITPDHQVVRYAGITEDITLQREVQAQAFALALSREKIELLQRFVRDASHDLRTPLSSILLKLDLLEKVQSERQKEVKQELRVAAQHLNSLIEDLFTLSRIEGEDSITQMPLNLNEIVQDVCDHHQIMAQNKRLGFFLHLADASLRIAGNRDQLFRLVTNLVSNAIQYTPHGTISIRTFVNDNHVNLTVADTGIGIPETVLAAIFEPFYRTDEARAVRHGGTGLGLAISKTIVEHHQGTITVESQPGHGTTFQVTFPLAEFSADESESDT